MTKKERNKTTHVIMGSTLKINPANPENLEKIKVQTK